MRRSVGRLGAPIQGSSCIPAAIIDVGYTLRRQIFRSRTLPLILLRCFVKAATLVRHSQHREIGCPPTAEGGDPAPVHRLLRPQGALRALQYSPFLLKVPCCPWPSRYRRRPRQQLRLLPNFLHSPFSSTTREEIRCKSNPSDGLSRDGLSCSFAQNQHMQLEEVFSAPQAGTCPWAFAEALLNHHW